MPPNQCRIRAKLTDNKSQRLIGKIAQAKEFKFMFVLVLTKKSVKCFVFMVVVSILNINTLLPWKKTYYYTLCNDSRISLASSLWVKSTTCFVRLIY